VIGEDAGARLASVRGCEVLLEPMPEEQVVAQDQAAGVARHEFAAGNDVTPSLSSSSASFFEIGIGEVGARSGNTAAISTPMAIRAM